MKSKMTTRCSDRVREKGRLVDGRRGRKSHAATDLESRNILLTSRVFWNEQCDKAMRCRARSAAVLSGAPCFGRDDVIAKVCLRLAFHRPALTQVLIGRTVAALSANQVKRALRASTFAGN